MDGETYAEQQERQKQERERNSAILDHWLPEWTRNSYRNVALVMKSKGMYHLAGAHKDVPAIVFGHGPSLDAALPAIARDQADGGQFITLVCNSSMQAATAHGIRADYTVLFDSGKANGNHFIGLNMRGQKLITHTAINPEVIDDLAVRGAEVYWFNMLAQGRPEVFKGPGRKKPSEMDPGELFTMSLIWAYGGHVGMSLPNAGCVINAAMLTAANLGCRPIILVGADLGYTGGRYSATNYELVEEAFTDPLTGQPTGEVHRRWQKKAAMTPEEEMDKILRRPALRSVNGCMCGLEMEEYARSLVFLAKNCIDGYGRSLEVINCTPGGILGQEIQRMRLEQALEVYCHPRPRLGSTVRPTPEAVAPDPQVPEVAVQP